MQSWSRYSCEACWDCNPVSHNLPSGFHKTWEAVKKGVMSEVWRLHNLYPKYVTVVSGHSLGGAVATLAAFVNFFWGGDMLQTNFWFLVCRVDIYYNVSGSVYSWTLGSPRVGNGHFADWYPTSGVAHTQRITNWRDVGSLKCSFYLWRDRNTCGLFSKRWLMTFQFLIFPMKSSSIDMSHRRHGNNRTPMCLLFAIPITERIPSALTVSFFLIASMITFITLGSMKTAKLSCNCFMQSISPLFLSCSLLRLSNLIKCGFVSFFPLDQQNQRIKVYNYGFAGSFLQMGIMRKYQMRVDCYFLHLNSTT